MKKYQFHKSEKSALQGRSMVLSINFIRFIILLEMDVSTLVNPLRISNGSLIMKSGKVRKRFPYNQKSTAVGDDMSGIDHVSVPYGSAWITARTATPSRRSALAGIPFMETGQVRMT